MIKFLIGGSPCTKWSIAQTKNRETKPCGIGWDLFNNFLVAKEKFDPDFFLYENNKSAAQEIKAQISKELNAPLLYINSALVSAQNRNRFYVTNISDIEQPFDRNIQIDDILESVTGNKPIALNITKNNKAQCLRSTCYKDGMRNLICNTVDKRTCVAEPLDTSSELKFIDKQCYKIENETIEYKHTTYPINLKNGHYLIRKLTVKECCRLQTLPDNYCDGVSKTSAYKGLGNGWTAEVIIHILQKALTNVPKDEEIVVLSMYDGIGTGRYCFDKLGYNNIKYYAYEIDHGAMQIANNNYPNIIQCGDAFQVLQDDWKIL